MTNAAVANRRGPVVQRVACALAAFLLTATAVAASERPYAAGGGFGRPESLGALGAPRIALGIDGSAQALLWRDGAVVAVALADPTATRPIAAAPNPTALAAARGSVPPLVVWSWRDLRDGAHVLSASDGRELWRGPQPLAPIGVTTDAGVRWFATGADGDGSHVVEIAADQLVRWYSTEKRLAGLSVAGDGSAVHLTWLEGISESGPFGGRAEWHAFETTLTGVALSAPANLGRADPSGAPTATALTADGVLRAWTDASGLVRRSDRSEPLGRGWVLGATGVGAIYRASGERIIRHAADGEAVAVAWSPVAIAGGDVLRDDDGTTHLAWFGTRQGGAREAFASDDRVPIALTWRDHLAAAFGWRPWSIAEEASGQAAASLLAAVLAAAAATPLLWLAAPLLAGRTGVARASRRGALAGVLLPLLALAGVAVAGGPGVALAGGWVGAALAPAIGMGIAVAAVARRDLERSAAFALAGAVAVLGATAVLTFTGFDAWLALGWFGSPGGAW